MNWGLRDAKPGDKLVIPHGFGNEQIVLVDRVTKTQVISGIHRYRIEDGYSVGSSGYHRAQARFATDADIERIEARRLRDLIHEMTKRDTKHKWHASALRSILACLESAAIKEPDGS